jgi:hypothetical protein
VTERAQYVRVDRTAVERAADQIVAGDISPDPPAWDSSLHWSGDDPERVANYVLALDALNFCFWGDPKWRVTYRGRVLDGYWALAAALTRAIAEGFDVTDASVMAGATRENLQEVFRGESEIPLLDARVAHLSEAGRVLLSRYEGRFSKAIREAGGSAERMVRSVAHEFSSFEDVAFYAGRRINLYKRAQILVIDLVSALPDQPWAQFTTLEDLTAFADYKVPQVLREIGIMTYSEALSRKVDSLVEIVAGSTEEVEIRAATVAAVHHLGQALSRRSRPVTEAALDGILWHLGQDMAFQFPYHRTRTPYY